MTWQMTSEAAPIMLAAEKAGVAPEDFIRAVQQGHERDFAGFGIVHDWYHTTHSHENRELAELVYARLKAGGHVAARSIRQLYDPARGMFLPDRYVKGTCPNCGTPDQYGDNCENCGATYAPTDLKDPRSVLSGANDPRSQSGTACCERSSSIVAMSKVGSRCTVLMPASASWRSCLVPALLRENAA